MKRKSISALALIIALVMLLGAAPAVLAAGPVIRAGDIVTLGSYPQTRVTGEALLKQLGALSPKWTSCGYYLEGASSDYMQYADVTLSGAKYRAVKFSQYRTYLPDYPVFPEYTWQDDSGYSVNTVYWFKYEPIKWRVLDPSAGLIVSESLLDSQAFNNVSADASWSASSLRAWLNGEFFSAAFSDADKAYIKSSVLEQGVSDKVFILSADDAENKNYGFAPYLKYRDEARIARGTDYARSQGLRASSYTTYEGNCYWWLRTAGAVAKQALVADPHGRVYADGDRVERTSNGVLPAISVTGLASLISYDGWVEDGVNVFYYEDGAQVKNTEKTIDGVVCVFDSEGRLSGIRVNGELVTQDALICINDGIYCLRDGRIVTGFNLILGGSNRYFAKDGRLSADEEFFTVTSGDVYYLLDSTVVKGRQVIGGYIYNFGDDGIMHRNEANYDADGRLFGDIAELDFEVSPVDDEYFTGSPITPAVSVSFDGITLDEGVFYTVSYADNIDIGTAALTVSGVGALTGSIDLSFEILPPLVTGISIDRTFLEMVYKQDETEKLNATVYPGNAGDKSFKWASSDTSVATVDDDGNVTAQGRGSAVITATTEDGGRTASCIVTVDYVWWQWLVKLLLFGWIWY